jgi:hypothetical protein
MSQECKIRPKTFAFSNLPDKGSIKIITLQNYIMKKIWLAAARDGQHTYCGCSALQGKSNMQKMLLGCAGFSPNYFFGSKRKEKEWHFLRFNMEPKTRSAPWTGHSAHPTGCAGFFSFRSKTKTSGISPFGSKN